MGTIQVWQDGEQYAANHLLRLGWQILDRNWSCSAGELDIIAYDPQAQQVVFCEVKTRRGLGYGQPLEAITAAKVAKLREVALHWLKSQPKPVASLRFDGIGIVLPRGGPVELTHRKEIC